MALSSGTRIGPYEILSALGAGGMGEVYRARDTKLNRLVAVKVLPDVFARDTERLERFTREAQTLGALNHPHIAQIYGLEESDGVRALVMELVEGEDLSQRIARGPLPLDEALPMAAQIVDALEAAHEHGIIHRDLKPANVKVRSDGTVKVLDFGLAKALEPPGMPSSGVAQQRPTITSPAMMTGAGTLLGTAAYMSPEQARGKPVDRRADIWAFGCVLYEMLAGRRAFEGEDIADTLAFVITKEPDWSVLPADLPPALRRLLHRCLTKDPKRRLAHVADARLEMEEASTPAPEFHGASTRQSTIPGRRAALAWLTVAVLGIALVTLLTVWAPWRGEPIRTPIKLNVALGGDLALNAGAGFGPTIAMSPDGKVLAFTATPAGARSRSRLFVRRLDQLTATPLPGTEGAVGPFFSRDGHWIAFFADGRLKRIPVAGGPAVTLADAEDPRGGDWGEHDTVLFSPGRRGASVLRALAAGSQPVPLSPEDPIEGDDVIQRWPQVLPGGDTVLYTSHSASGDFDKANLVVRPLGGGARKVVVRGGYHGRYLRSGHLVYVREGTLLAVPFDLERLETSGPPVPFVDGVISSTLSGAAQFAISQEGTLAYVAGTMFSSSPLIAWLRATGEMTPLRAMNAVWENLDIAPDGRRLAFDMYDGKQWDIWVYEWERDTTSRLTLSRATRPLWTPDSERVVFSGRDGEGAASLQWLRADGAGGIERLTKGAHPQRAGSWHPSGRVLAFVALNPQTNWDVMILPLSGDDASGWKPGTPFPFVSAPFAEVEPTFSPDGQWLAYQSNETGQDEVYVRPFPGPGPRVPISSGGGTHPLWSPTHRELFYNVGEGRIMTAAYTVRDNTFIPQKPRVWAEGRFTVRPAVSLSRSIDVHPDGERFAVASAAASDNSVTHNHVTLIFNVFDELRRIAPPAP